MVDQIQAQRQLKIVGPGDTPRERLCVQSLQALLLKLQQKTGHMPVACMIAFQWEGEETKMFLAAENGDAAADVQMGVLEEIQSAHEVGAQAIAKDTPPPADEKQ